MTRSRVVFSLSRVLPTSQVFTPGYVNMENILHFFYKITKERGTKTMFTYAHVKWFYGQSERILFELFYNLIFHLKGGVLLDGGSILDRRLLRE